MAEVGLRKVIGGAVLVLCAACSSSSPPQPAQCAARNGGYTERFAERPGGTCGPIPATVITLTAGRAPDAGCGGSRVLSPDNCTVTTDLTCPRPGGAQHQVGTVNWSADGKSASGTIKVDVSDSDGGTCSSTYGVVAFAGECTPNGSPCKSPGYGISDSTCCSGWCEGNGQCACMAAARCSNDDDCCTTPSTLARKVSPNEFCPQYSGAECQACKPDGQPCNYLAPNECCSKRCIARNGGYFCASCISPADSQPCSSDAQCCAGSYCTRGGQCASCVLAGDTCRSGIACCQGQCLNGHCPPIYQPGSPCVRDTDCSTGRCGDAPLADGGVGSECCTPAGLPRVPPGRCCAGSQLDGIGNCRACQEYAFGCTSSAQCCQTDGELVCRAGACVPCVKLGEACTVYTDCCGGNLCLGGVCTVPPPPPCTGQRGSPCFTDSECCSRKCISATVCSCLGGGAACTTSAACCSGNCAGGTCTCSLGASPCTRDDECCFNQCLGGYCAVSGSSSGGSSSGLCPTGQYPLTQNGPCSPDPGENCPAGTVRCTCPSEHGMWCHRLCQLPTVCGGARNPDFPCR